MNERLKKTLELSLSLSSLYLLSQAILGSFSYEVRQKIKERDRYTCVSCGAKNVPLDASHVRHNRKLPEYNLPENGHCKCAKCHYLEHFYQLDNTVNFHVHESACRLIWDRLDQEDKVKLPSPEMIVRKRVRV